MIAHVISNVMSTGSQPPLTRPRLPPVRRLQALAVLRELGSLIDAQVADARPLLRLSGIVEHALQQRPLPQAAAATAAYSIQWLDLRVAPPEARQQQQRQQATVATQQ